MKKHYEESFVIERVHYYLKKYGWDKLVIGIRVERLRLIFGDDAPSALVRFIHFAIENKMKFNFIAETLGHDLDGVGTDCFSPRTSGF